MNKLLRTVIFFSLLSISLASYFFLQVQHHRTNQGQHLEQPILEQNEQQSTPFLPAPDVFLVKKVFETARHFVPVGTLNY